MPDIVEHQHSYVPGHASDRPIRTVVAGDLLTCERTSGAMEDVRNDDTKSGCREGMIPVIADFHLLGNFYQVSELHGNCPVHMFISVGSL